MTQPENKTDEDKEDRVLILDYDDTLLASSYLKNADRRLDNTILVDHPELKKELEELADAVIRTLNAARKQEYKCYIVTNAEAGWVQLSAARFIPRVLIYILDHNIPIFSACTVYKPSGIKEDMWKYHMIVSILTKHPNLTELTQVGDSFHERFAVQKIGTERPNLRIKSIKFEQYSSPMHLIRQLNLLAEYFWTVRQCPNSMDYAFTVLKQPEPSEPSNPEPIVTCKVKTD